MDTDKIVNTKPEPEGPLGLCWRCEHRAHYHEVQRGPRCECGGSGAVGSCYMYKPCYPVALRRSDSERTLHGRQRPVAGPGMIAARCQGVLITDAELVGKKIRKKGVALLWVIPERKKAK